MRRILLASHGELAKGMYETLKFFVGPNKKIDVICAYVDDVDLEVELKKFFSSTKPEDEILIFTDLLGGSVNQQCIKYLTRENVYIIAGMFLGLILEFLMNMDKKLTEVEINKIVQDSKKNVVYMNDYFINTDDIDD